MSAQIDAEERGVGTVGSPVEDVQQCAAPADNGNATRSGTSRAPTSRLKPKSQPKPKNAKPRKASTVQPRKARASAAEPQKAKPTMKTGGKQTKDDAAAAANLKSTGRKSTGNGNASGNGNARASTAKRSSTNNNAYIQQPDIAPIWNNLNNRPQRYLSLSTRVQKCPNEETYSDDESDLDSPDKEGNGEESSSSSSSSASGNSSGRSSSSSSSTATTGGGDGIHDSGEASSSGSSMSSCSTTTTKSNIGHRKSLYKSIPPPPPGNLNKARKKTGKGPGTATAEPAKIGYCFGYNPGADWNLNVYWNLQRNQKNTMEMAVQRK